MYYIEGNWLKEILFMEPFPGKVVEVLTQDQAPKNWDLEDRLKRPFHAGKM